LVFNDRLSPVQFDGSSSTGNDTLLSDVVITTADVRQALCFLDPNKADGVSPKVLKYCADVLCQPIGVSFSINYYQWPPANRMADTLCYSHT